MLFNSTTPEADKCEVCQTTENVVLGKWMFHCPEHKINDLIADYDNTLALPVSKSDTPFLLI